MSLPVAHGSGGHATSHYAGSADISVRHNETGESGNETATPRARYDWADDAHKSYLLANAYIGVRVAKERLLKALAQ